MTTYFVYTVPIRLVVISGYVVPPAIVTFPDTRYEARAAYISVQAQGAKNPTAVASNLNYLAELAWSVGFDFIQFRAPDNLRVSTIPDGSSNLVALLSLPPYFLLSFFILGCSSDIDLAFLLDGSESVTLAGFQQALGKMAFSYPLHCLFIGLFIF